nr:MAG TPA: hypothetical protein [Caudoviricetes sp.]
MVDGPSDIRLRHRRRLRFAHFLFLSLGMVYSS